MSSTSRDCSRGGRVSGRLGAERRDRLEGSAGCATAPRISRPYTPPGPARSRARRACPLPYHCSVAAAPAGTGGGGTAAGCGAPA